MTEAFRTVYADPPWMERGGGKITRGANRHYPLMKTDDIIALMRQQMVNVAPDAHLYLWVTNNFLPDGLRVIQALGFRYITCITWVKPRVGLGQYYRGKTEQCLFAVRGNLPYKVGNPGKAPYNNTQGKRQQGVTAIHADLGRHSEKPSEMRAMIAKVSYGPFLELFARKPVPGWTVWGNEVEQVLTTTVGGILDGNQPRLNL